MYNQVTFREIIYGFFDKVICYSLKTLRRLLHIEYVVIKKPLLMSTYHIHGQMSTNAQYIVQFLL